MGNGYEGLVLLVVLAFWVLEAIASARKKRRGQEEPVSIEEVEEVEAPSGRSSMDPHHADVPGRDVHRGGADRRDEYQRLPDRPSGRPMTAGERSGRTASPAAGAGDRDARKGEGAAGMLPKELWEELAALARGETPPAAKPAPAPEPAPPPVPARAPRPGAGGMQTAPGRTAAETASDRRRDGHGLASRRRTHEGEAPRRDVVGSDAAMAARVRHTPAARMQERQEGVPGVQRRGDSDAFRALLGTGSPAELRRAMILAEILGPPVSMRGGPPGPPPPPAPDQRNRSTGA